MPKNPYIQRRVGVEDLQDTNEHIAQLEKNIIDMKNFPKEIDERAIKLDQEFGIELQPTIINEMKGFAYKQALALMGQLETARAKKEKQHEEDNKVH